MVTETELQQVGAREETACGHHVVIKEFFQNLLQLYTSTLLFIHSVSKSLHLPIPTSHSIPACPSPLAISSLFSMSLILFLFHT